MKGNICQHYLNELDILKKKMLAEMPEGANPGDHLPIIAHFSPELTAIFNKFENMGLSGGAAPYYIGALSESIENILMFKPLSPITGEETEWAKTGFGGDDENPIEVYQNKRLSALFKYGVKGKPHYLRSIIWVATNDVMFTGTVDGVGSSNFVKEMPFEPKTFEIEVEEVPTGSGSDFTYRIKNKSDLDKVWEHYDQMKEEDRPFNPPIEE